MDLAAAQKVLAETLVARGTVPENATWRRLTGGRSNLVWSVATAAGDRICKLYDERAQTPLFPNDPAAERIALESLRGSGLAPVVRDAGSCPSGRFLVYDAVPGRTGSGDPAEIVRRLAELHRKVPPAGLRAMSLDAARIIDEGHGMLSACGRLDLASRQPEAPEAEAAPQVFLHGDPVPSNILDAGDRIVFVDWQCPAAGDAVFDLAVFLSPSMQIASGRRPFDEADILRVIASYGSGSVSRRFLAWRPLLTWRFACYAAWKARNDESYARGLEAELALLERLLDQDDDRRRGGAGPA